MKQSFDVVVIGSGHNGLVTACYLAKAGYSVCVLERRENIGGAVCTETMFKSKENPQGFRMDVGSSAHFMIHQTGIIEELELNKYGLEYIDLDPFASFPVHDRKGVIHFFKDLDRTLDSIASIAPEDVEHYREFVEYWTRVNKRVLNVFMKPPTMKNIMSEMIKGQIKGKGMFKKGEQVQGIKRILGSYGQLINDTFESPYLKTAILWLAAQSGPMPDQTATADFAGWHAMYHQSGAKHPKGGSGMLTQAMAKMLEAYRGVIKTSSPVDEILIRGNSAYGVRLHSGEEIYGKKVVSNAHVQTTMLKLVGPDNLSSDMVTRVKDINVGNGFGMVIRCAVDDLPDYDACRDDPYVHNGLQLLCPSVQFMNNAMGQFAKGAPPDKPPVVAMTFSKVDQDVAPDGKHTLFAWGQWHPYRLANGENWDDIREREADKIYQTVVDYAPNMQGKLIDRYIQTPLDIERKHGMINGNVMHVEMTFDQMFMFRPIPAMSEYRTPIKNLYLSSASCHPGGGVFGAAGYNAASVILKDLKRSKWFKRYKNEE
jgi:phytoene dehydrogenase-like protein